MNEIALFTFILGMCAGMDIAIAVKRYHDGYPRWKLNVLFALIATVAAVIWMTR